MIIENTEINGEDQFNTTWHGNSSYNTIIDENGQGYETYNCLQCQNQVFLINGDETHKGGLASNHIITKNSSYRYGNYVEGGTCEACVNDCYAACHNSVVTLLKEESIADRAWSTVGYFYISCEKMSVGAPPESGSTISDVIREYITCTNTVNFRDGMYIPGTGAGIGMNGFATGHYYTDDSIVKIKEGCINSWYTEGGSCDMIVSVPVKKTINFTPPKPIAFCYTTVSCIHGVTPWRENEDGWSPSTDTIAGRGSYYWVDPRDTTYYCTNRNSRAQAGAGGINIPPDLYAAAESVGTGYCPFCVGCNEGCTVACYATY